MQERSRFPLELFFSGIFRSEGRAIGSAEGKILATSEGKVMASVEKEHVFDHEPKSTKTAKQENSSSSSSSIISGRVIGSPPYPPQRTSLNIVIIISLVLSVNFVRVTF